MGHKFLRKTKLECMRQSLFLALGKPQNYFFFIHYELSVGPNHTAFFCRQLLHQPLQKKIKNVKVNSDQQCYGNIFIYNLGADRSTKSPYPNTPADQKLGRQKTNHGSLVCLQMRPRVFSLWVLGETKKTAFRSLTMQWITAKKQPHMERACTWESFRDHSMRCNKNVAWEAFGCFYLNIASSICET